MSDLPTPTAPVPDASPAELLFNANIVVETEDDGVPFPVVDGVLPDLTAAATPWTAVAPRTTVFACLALTTLRIEGHDVPPVRARPGQVLVLTDPDGVGYGLFVLDAPAFRACFVPATDVGPEAEDLSELAPPALPPEGEPDDEELAHDHGPRAGDWVVVQLLDGGWIGGVACRWSYGEGPGLLLPEVALVDGRVLPEAAVTIPTERIRAIWRVDELTAKATRVQAEHPTNAPWGVPRQVIADNAAKIKVAA